MYCSAPCFFHITVYPGDLIIRYQKYFLFSHSFVMCHLWISCSLCYSWAQCFALTKHITILICQFSLMQVYLQGRFLEIGLLAHLGTFSRYYQNLFLLGCTVLDSHSNECLFPYSFTNSVLSDFQILVSLIGIVILCQVL